MSRRRKRKGSRLGKREKTEETIETKQIRGKGGKREREGMGG